LIIGGHQEEGNRGGTENVPYIAAFGRAAELARAIGPQDRQALAALRDSMEDEVLAKIPGTSRNGAKEPRLPNTSSISFAGVDAEALLLLLDQLKICASSGSACTTGSVAPSHVLTAMGLDPTEARSTIRFSLDYESTREDIAYLMNHLPRLISELRAAASPRTIARRAGTGSELAAQSA
jgi:cysteine desulfurase